MEIPGDTNKTGFRGLAKTLPFIFGPILGAGKDKRAALKVTQPLLWPALPLLIFSKSSQGRLLG